MNTPSQIQFRENWTTGKVDVLVDGKVTHSYNEYRHAAEYTKRRYNLSDAYMMELYRDYKEDYDNA